MEFLLLVLVILSGLIIIYCLFAISLEKEVFMKRISNLETQYKQQTQKHFFYKTQLEESKELEKKIWNANAFLNEAIFDLNKELFGELLLKNNL